jgi:prepilin-type processing-associated H-X9-DG protein
MRFTKQGAARRSVAMNDDNNPFLDYFNPQSNKKPWKISPLEILVVCGIIALLISILMPATRTVHAPSASVRCAANLKSLGVAIQMYLNDHHKEYMPDLITLGKSEKTLVPNILVCSTKTQLPSGRDQQWQYLKSNPNSIDYVFLGESQSYGWSKGKDRVIAYEKPGHHKLSPVLYADGHVDLLDDKKLRALIALIYAGQYAPNNQPVTQP